MHTAPQPMNSTPPRDNKHADTGHSIFSLLTGEHTRALNERESSEASGSDLEAYATDDVTELPGRSSILCTGSLTAAKDPRAAIEKAFPQLTALLLRVWQHQEAGRTLRKLMVDPSGRARRLPTEVFDELSLLRTVHDISHITYVELPPSRPGTKVNPRRLSVLETRYPHVLARLIRDWDTAKIDDTFLDLITDTRGTRHGWPPDAWDELTLLHAVRARIQHDQAVARRLKASGLV